MPAKAISLVELQNRLDQLKGARVVSFIARTKPEMRKTDNPYWERVTKVSKVVGMVNWIYQNSVNRQRIREDSEPDFEALPRSWGERIHGKPFVTHKDNLYLEVKVESAIQTQYFVDGVPVEREVIAEWLRPSSEPIRQELEKPVILRDYKLENIRQIDGLPSEKHESEYCVVQPVATSV